MRWKGRRVSSNVEDRRSSRPSRSRGGGRTLGRSMGGSIGRSKSVKLGGGLGTVAIIILFLLIGGNPQQLIQSLPTTNQSQGGSQATSGTPITEADDEHAVFVSTVLADTEDVWNRLLPEFGTRYVEPTMVLFRDEVRSACGFASSATGPFYCPADQKVYLDLSFFDQLAQRFDAPGDFAQAYVIAHEVGHHVQHLLGVTDQVHRQRGRISEEEYNALSVRLELQADFYAGVWAHHAQRSKDILEPGDLDEALTAASAIGDDAIQKKMQGYIVPESFTHGTSDQRIRWFRHGFETGDPSLGDTFRLPDP